MVMRGNACGLLTVCVAGALGSGAAARGDVVYAQDFQTGTSFPGWSTGATQTAPAFSRFLGRFSSQLVTLTLTLPALPPPGPDFGEPGGGGDGGGGSPGPYWTYVLDFDFYCIDSWDGYGMYGPDRFIVRAGGVTLLSETFANQHEYQSYPGAPVLGPEFLGFNPTWRDSIYHLSLAFVVPGGPTQLAFEATGLSSLHDESWGIDNVVVSAVLVPAPWSAGVLGLAWWARRRRR